MANPLEAWKQHATASEHMDLMGVGSHQKKGWNFAQNFPALVPGTGVGPAQWVGPTLATGYQLGQEGLRSLLPEKWGGTDIGFADAMKKGWTEAKQNIQGMGGKGFDKDEYDEWMHAQGYAPDYDFSDIEGQTAFLDPVSLFTLGSKILGPAYAYKTGGINELIKYKMRKDLTDKGWKKTQEILKAKAAADAAAADAAAAEQNRLARSRQVIHDPGSGGGGGGGTWHQQTAAKEKAGKQVAGPGFGKGAYFRDGGLTNFYRYGGFV